jgi:endonuclease/exonuclease/phosphatase (EEP) superfamily protein YafD
LAHCQECGTVLIPEESAGGSRATAPRGWVRTWLGHCSGLATWTWGLAVLTVLLLIRWVGDRWWGVTILLFLPRWIFLTPLPVLALGSGLAGRYRQWIVQSVVTLVIAGPLMALSLPIHQLWDRPPQGLRVRVMTLNRGQYGLDVAELTRLIEREQIDLICFQEGNPRPGAVLDHYFAAHGWHRDSRGYVASHHRIVGELPPLPVETGTGGHYSVILARVRIRTAGGVEFTLASAHMPTLRFGLYRFLDQDVAGFLEHVSWWDRQIVRLLDGLAEVRDAPLLMGGDFNVPPDHATMAALGSCFRFAFEDAGWGYGYTRPSRYPWFRIDHILASPEWVFTRSWVGPDVGSDHLPLIAEALLPAPSHPPRPAGERSQGQKE